MNNLFKGNVIFKKDVSARLAIFYPNELQMFEKPTILCAESLTTELTFCIINNPVVGVITDESSFATHGANILRSRAKITGQKPSWITGINIAEISKYSGYTVYMKKDGRVIIDHEEKIFENEYIENGYSPTPMQKRSIVQYDLTNNNYKICYWPHRRFNRLTYSIWRTGLEKNLIDFGIKDPLVELIDEKIWFSNCPMMSEYIELASDIKYASIVLDKQIELYHSFYSAIVDNRYSNEDLIRMSSDFFSIFLLFHDTYEDVFLNAFHLFEENMGDLMCYPAFNNLLNCKIDLWMLENNILLRKKKDFLSDEKEVPLPSFSIYDDLEDTEDSFKKYLINSGFKSFYEDYYFDISFYIHCFVAKEWKFVMIKALSTRFSEIIRKELPSLSFDMISDMDLIDVKKMLK